MGTVSQDKLKEEDITKEHPPTNTRETTMIGAGKHLFRRLVYPRALISRSKHIYSGHSLPEFDHWVGITLTDLAPVIATMSPSGVSPTTSTLSAPATPGAWIATSG